MATRLQCHGCLKGFSQFRYTRHNQEGVTRRERSCEVTANHPGDVLHLAGARPVQKYKRTQDWRAGPFRSSSPRGEPQILGVSEVMSEIRVPRTRRENTIQQRDATLPGGDLAPRPGPHLDQNVLAGYAAVALALILDTSGGLFSDAARPGQRPFSPLAQTWHSKIEIRDEYRK